MKPSPVLRYYLGGLLAAMAIGQIVSWSHFRAAIDSYQVGTLAVPIAATLLAGEAVAAAGLLSGRSLRPSALIALGTATLWTILATQAFARGLVVPNCGCFGRFLSQELRWWVLLEDVAFVGYGVLLVKRLLPSPHEDRKDRGRVAEAAPS